MHYRRATPWLLALAVCTADTAVARAEQERAVEARLKRDVSYLASPECEGRGPTTEGINRAAAYIAERFRKAGLQPGAKGSYFQPFRIAGAEGALTLTGPNRQRLVLRQPNHFVPLGYDQEGEVSGPLVFAGYGLSTRDYDDYAGLDVKDKVVVLLRDTPRPGQAGRPREFLAGAPLLTKIRLAQKKGAKAVLLANDADSAEEGDYPADYTYTTLGRGGRHLPALFVRRSVVEGLFPTGKRLGDVEKAIDRDLKPDSFALTGWSADLEVKRNPELLPLKNVVGVLPGKGPLANETVVVGAHYDHLGYGGPSSMAPSKRRQIHPGADDNGSGTTAILELARRFAARKDRQGRRLVFIAFSGEEINLLGSRAYCKHPLFPLGKTAAMFNLDMIGRLRPDRKTGKGRLLTQGHGTARPFKEMIDNLAKKYDLTLASRASGFGPSDHSSFCEKDVPVLFLWTDEHEDYHAPTDTADRLNLAGMRRIIDLSEEAITTLTQMDKPAFVEVPGGAGGPRPTDGPRLGIRPGYGSDEPGVPVGGVSPGGPAERGGVKSGDVIVALAGKPVKDIRTYMTILGSQKKGSTVEVEVQRNGKKVKLSVKLE